MPKSHQKWAEWTPQRFINWAESIDDSVKIFITNLLEKKQHPEQAYKSCMGVLSFAKKVGNKRLVNACKRALDYEIYNYKIIQKILQKGLDMYTQEENQELQQLPEHYNIRGEKYYK